MAQTRRRIGPDATQTPRKSAIVTSPEHNAGKPKQTFPRQLRLLRAADFDSVFQNAQRSADRLFTVLYHHNNLAQPRLGFAISKQKVRLAVGRNRLRRLVRESFRKRAATLPPVDLVVLARESTKAAANSEVCASLEKHWARIATGARKPTGSSGK